MAHLSPTRVLHWVAQINPWFFHSHCNCLSWDPVSFFHTLFISSLPASQPSCLDSFVELLKISLQLCHPRAQILLQPSHCLQDGVQALQGVPEGPCWLTPSYHLNFIPTSLFQERTAPVSRAIQGLLGLISAFQQTSCTYSCPLFCRHPIQPSRPISNAASYMKFFCSPSS